MCKLEVINMKQMIKYGCNAVNVKYSESLYGTV